MSSLEFRPSKADRLVACPNSAVLCATLPEPPSSPYAAEGTRLHEVAAKVLTQRPTNKAGVTVEDMEAISVYLDYIRGQSSYGRYRIVQRVEIVEGMAGTLDADLLHEEWIEVVDLKTGSEGLVAAYRDEALTWFALGALIALLVLSIGQRSLPRVFRVLLPVILAVVLTAAALALAGTAFSLFHLLSMLLVVGVGLEPVPVDVVLVGRPADLHHLDELDGPVG